MPELDTELLRFPRWELALTVLPPEDADDTVEFCRRGTG
jgi:hypothetical protein